MQAFIVILDVDSVALPHGVAFQSMVSGVGAPHKAILLEVGNSRLKIMVPILKGLFLKVNFP